MSNMSNMQSITVGKTYHFDSAHFLPGHDKCGIIHGHTWTLKVEITGIPDDHGFVVDFHTLNKIVNQVIEPFDHTILNNFIERPTCENLAWYVKSQIWEALNQPNWDNIKVTLQEGQGGYAIA